MGAWIEIICEVTPPLVYPVAPLVGAWIEIYEPGNIKMVYGVAPLVGAWIEIAAIALSTSNDESRSPCGSVD